MPDVDVVPGGVIAGSKRYGSAHRTAYSKSQAQAETFWFQQLTPTSDMSMTTFYALMDQATGKIGGLDVAGGGYEARITVALKVRNLIGSWLKSYVQRPNGFEDFKRRWKYGRCCIDLQSRLMVEQILFELGNPWRSLVSGFGPL